MYIYVICAFSKIELHSFSFHLCFYPFLHCVFSSMLWHLFFIAFSSLPSSLFPFPFVVFFPFLFFVFGLCPFSLFIFPLVVFPLALMCFVLEYLLFCPLHPFHCFLWPFSFYLLAIFVLSRGPFFFVSFCFSGGASASGIGL